jgi:hypothetical protein
MDKLHPFPKVVSFKGLGEMNFMREFCDMVEYSMTSLGKFATSQPWFVLK